MVQIIYKKTSIVPGLILVLMLLSHPLFSQQFVAGSSVAKEEVLRKIPQEFIDKARRELVIAYQHTSHGTHVSRGIFGLQDYKMGDTLLFGVSSDPAADSLEFRDYALEDYAPPGVTAIDLSVEEDAFIQTSRNYLDAPENATVNVIMWSWCNIDGHDAADNYLPGMDSLISEYGPGGTKIGTGEGLRELPVTFIFMTAHANVDANVGNPTRPMEQADTITSHCDSIEQYCLDYYSIDTHDMDDMYWEDAGDDGNSSSYGGNFYHDWQDSHILGEDYFENKMTPGGYVVYGEHTTQHITANRKGYAMWWILARIAGWDGDTTYIPVTSIELSSAGDASELASGDTLRFSALVLPDTATYGEVDWSVINDTGTATIDSLGLLTAGDTGMVTVVAMAQDTSGVSDSLSIYILPPPVLVSSVDISSAGGLTELRSGDTLRFSASVLPDTASNKELEWSISNGTGTASIDSLGLLSAGNPGSVTVIATAKDVSGVSDSFPMSILAPLYTVTGITLESAGGLDSLESGQTLQFSAIVVPDTASNKNLAWSISNGTGTATITVDGLLSAGNPGTVTVLASALDGSGISDSLLITITAPVYMVSSITLSSADSITEMKSGASLQFSAIVVPATASNKELDWSVSNGTGTASINVDGLLTAGIPGTVTVVAAAQDGSGVTGSFELSITSPDVMVSSITISSEGDVLEIEEGEMLQLHASVNPTDADNSSVYWHVTAAKNSMGQGSITQKGVFIALAEGEVDVVAIAQDGSGVSALFTLTVLGPSTTEENKSASLNLYPNPGQGLFYLNAGDLKVELIKVLDARGGVILELVPDSGNQIIELDLTSQQAGFYIIKARAGDQFFVRQAIIFR